MITFVAPSSLPTALDPPSPAPAAHDAGVPEEDVLVEQVLQVAVAQLQDHDPRLVGAVGRAAESEPADLHDVRVLQLCQSAELVAQVALVARREDHLHRHLVQPLEAVVQRQPEGWLQPIDAVDRALDALLDHVPVGVSAAAKPPARAPSSPVFRSSWCAETCSTGRAAAPAESPRILQ